MTTFEKLKDKIHSRSNSNFHFDKLDWEVQVWIKGLCEIIDEGKFINITMKEDSFSLYRSAMKENEK
ncbi:hypothetical protein LCGC14_2100230 [marine sediment metagenome]|uniref:Uncharacterized protein n=1 Tax=marine sediment metagenome TaxID=412755 RepID=A0A0F9GNA8_9ZZZZ